jgi:DNA-directed RNA polymerase subunit beta'
MVDKIMTLGFENACKAGISFGKDDMVVPEAKKTLIAETSKQVKEIEQQYQNGLITKGEKYNKVIDIWAACNYKIADEMMKTISKVDHGYMNSIFMMADSGARGSKEQMRQLGGMRGLMAKPNGAIIEQPIISNFKEGLTVSEFFSSTHGARKGLSDTALKTANSGYLTRRLVDVAQDVVVTETNCGTERGIIVRPVVDGGNVIASIGERILGRTAQEDIVNPETGEVIVQKGHLINENDVDRVEKAGVEQVKIRSVLTCESEHGVCAACYGRDLARGTPVNVGEAVGVIAAQSIGEPGTQLTMRTFHIGGAASASAAQSSIEVPFSGILKLENAHTVENVAGHLVVLSRNCEILITDGQGREKSRHRIPYGTEILVKEGTEVEKGQKVAEWDPFTVPVISEKGGKVELVDLINGISMKESQDETTGVVSKIVTDWRGGPNSQANLRPSIVLKDKKGKPVTFDNGREVRYYLSADAVLAVDNGTEINPGDMIARLPKESLKSKDITGGLPRVAELFEARKPKDPAIISDVDGIVEFGKDYKSKQRIVVKDANEKEWEYLVPKGRRLVVQDGDNVKKGDMLVEGTPAPHDILRVLGVEKLAEYLVKEVQDVYRMQGVKINDKHIEVIVSQMLRKVEVTNPGDTTLLIGEQLDADEFEAENQKTINEGGTPAEATPVLLGITKASLQTKSFISAASFQETTRVLTEAAVQGKVDQLHGLKENVIVGRLVPAGTGSVLRSLKKVAAQNDHAIEQMKQEEAAAAALEHNAASEE